MIMFNKRIEYYMEEFFLERRYIPALSIIWTFISTSEALLHLEIYQLF